MMTNLRGVNTVAQALRVQSAAGSKRSSTVGGLIASLLIAALSACSGSHAKPQVSSITFTDANGNTVPAVIALKAGTGIYMMVSLKDDTSLLGANWLVTCGSELPPGTPLPPGQTVDESCGFFTPVHTASGPVPSYAASGAGVVTLYEAPNTAPKAGVVTLYATATNDPAVFSAITLSVVP